MEEDSGELINIVDADDENLGGKIGRMKNGVVLFFANWCRHSKKSLLLITKLAKEYNNLGFVRVLVSMEEGDGRIFIVTPKIKKSLGIERYPQWGVFQNGILDINLVISEKDEEGQLADVRKLIRKI